MSNEEILDKWLAEELRQGVGKGALELIRRVRLDEREKTAAEIKRLEAIVAKLPKFADTGEPFVPSTCASWALVGGMAIDALPALHHDYNEWLPANAQYHDLFVGWYSSAEAAEAAEAAKEATK